MQKIKEGHPKLLKAEQELANMIEANRDASGVKTRYIQEDIKRKRSIISA
jgi:hypothetical protein